MARQFDSEILIDKDDKWIFRGNEIVQEDILIYFRKNLQQDEKGVFIQNKFGELEEHGYLNLIGYPVHVTRVTEEGGTLFFSTDRGITFGLEDMNLRISDQGQLLAVETGKEKIIYRFNRSAGSQIAEWIEEDGERELRQEIKNDGASANLGDGELSGEGKSNEGGDEKKYSVITGEDNPGSFNLVFNGKKIPIELMI